MVRSRTWRLSKKCTPPNKILGKSYYPLKGESKVSISNRSKAKMPEAYNKLYKEIQRNVTIFNKMYHTKNSQINPSAKKILRSFEDEGTMHIFLDIVCNDIIPNSFYGPTRHKRCMKRLLTLMFTRARSECIYTPSICYGLDVDKVPWLEAVDVNQQKKFLLLGIKKVLSRIIAPLFKKLYYPLYCKRSYKIQFIPRNLWQSYVQKVKNLLITTKQIIQQDQGVNTKRNIIGYLYIIPKNGLGDATNFRAYAKADPKENYISRCEKKRINKLLYDLAKTMCPISVCKFHEHWKMYVNFIQDQQIYGVKLDVTDCFGNVKIDTLIQVIARCGNKLPLHIKQYLIKKINNQYVHFGREKDVIGKRLQVYKWNHGLIQGEKFSAPLCEVYMSYMDSLHLQKFSKTGRFLERQVDDYMFCSPDPEEVLDFIRTVSSYMNINHKKTQSNLNRDCCELEYCGYLVNLNSREIKKRFKFEKNAFMHYNFKIWNPKENMRSKSILTRSMYYPYNNHYFSKTLLNLHYNSAATVYENYFSAMVYLAFKFDCAVMAAFSRKVEEKNLNLLQSIISNTVFYYARRAMKTVPDGVSRNRLIKIGYNAFLVVLKKRQIAVYKDIVKGIAKLLACIEPDFRLYKLPKEFENIAMKRVVMKS